MSSSINAMEKNTAGMGGECESREDRKLLQGGGIGADPELEGTRQCRCQGEGQDFLGTDLTYDSGLFYVTQGTSPFVPVFSSEKWK